MMRRPLAVLAVALIASAAPGCSTKAKLGVGNDVGFCRGWIEWDALDEPRLTNRSEVVRWADGSLRIIKRVDLHVKMNRHDPPPTVKPLLMTVDHELRTYRDAVMAARDAESMRVAAARFAAGPFDRSTQTLTTLAGAGCTKADKAG